MYYGKVACRIRDILLRTACGRLLRQMATHRGKVDHQFEFARRLLGLLSVLEINGCRCLPLCWCCAETDAHELIMCAAPSGPLLIARDRHVHTRTWAWLWCVLVRKADSSTIRALMSPQWRYHKHSLPTVMDINVFLTHWRLTHLIFILSIISTK